jgi:hypothetical protein
MRNRDKTRYQLFLEPRLAERLEQLATRPGVSRSAILVEALDAWLSRQGTHELDERFGPRLDRISKQNARVQRDIQVLLESLSLFLHYLFCLHAQLPEPDAAARAIGRDRFQKFVDQVGRRIGGTPTFPDEDAGTEARR